MGQIHITPNPDPAGPALKISFQDCAPPLAGDRYAAAVQLTINGPARLTEEADSASSAPAPAAGRTPLAQLLELLDLLPDPAPCYKCPYCQASAAYGNEATARGCQEFALRAARANPAAAGPESPPAAAPKPPAA